MNIKLKEDFINQMIYIPLENKATLGKFIDVELYPWLYKRYPELFDVIPDKKSVSTSGTSGTSKK